MAKSNVIGAIVAVAFYLSAILVFVLRLFNKIDYGTWIGYFIFILTMPLLYLLYQAPSLQRPPLYYIQIGCFLIWLVMEALLDYIFKIDFRHSRWLVIVYVMFFFAGAGGLLGLAAQAGRNWTIVAVILFFIMSLLAFWQRAATGI